MMEGVIVVVGFLVSGVMAILKLFGVLLLSWWWVAAPLMLAVFIAACLGGDILTAILAEDYFEDIGQD